MTFEIPPRFLPATCSSYTAADAAHDGLRTGWLTTRSAMVAATTAGIGLYRQQRAIRPERYHRGRADNARRPWVAALSRLHANGYRDGEIAEYLSQLSSLAIATLELGGCWRWHEFEKYLVPGSADVTWTRRQVGYHRRKLGLPRNGLRLQAVRSESPEARRSQGWRIHQAYTNWGHLLPSIELRPRECDILCLLRDEGPKTREAISKALSVGGAYSGLRSRNCRYLDSLMVHGLIVGTGKGAARTYRLTVKAGGAALPARKRLNLADALADGLFALGADVGKSG